MKITKYNEYAVSQPHHYVKIEILNGWNLPGILYDI